MTLTYSYINLLDNKLYTHVREYTSMHYSVLVNMNFNDESTINTQNFKRVKKLCTVYSVSRPVLMRLLDLLT